MELIDGSKKTIEEAKEIVGNLNPQKIGDLITQWQADELKEKGLFIRLSEEGVLFDLDALADDSDVDVLEIKASLIERNYFVNLEINAVFSFPKGEVCAFAGYKLMYFREK